MAENNAETTITPSSVNLTPLNEFLANVCPPILDVSRGEFEQALLQPSTQAILREFATDSQARSFMTLRRELASDASEGRDGVFSFSVFVMNLSYWCIQVHRPHLTLGSSLNWRFHLKEPERRPSHSLSVPHTQL